jgi:hypothetical protein
MNWSVDAPLTIHQHDDEGMAETTGGGKADLDTKEEIEMIEHGSK